MSSEPLTAHIAKRSVLKKRDARQLLEGGHEQWNRWFEEHPNHTVDFEDEDFAGPVASMHFRFPDGTNFKGVTFRAPANFSGAIFGGTVHFDCATFLDNVVFLKARFEKDSYFIGATFKKTASFPRAVFNGPAHFRDATFDNRALFTQNVTFTNKADFDSVTAQKALDFSNASFEDIPDFTAVKGTHFIVLSDVKFDLPMPETLKSKILYKITGIRKSRIDMISRLRVLRGIANATHSSDAERDLSILERNAEIGWHLSKMFIIRPVRTWLVLLVNAVLASLKDCVALDPSPDTEDKWLKEREFRNNRKWFWHFYKVLSGSFLLVIYKWLSDYGRKLWLPVLWLVLSFHFFYWWYSKSYAKISRLCLSDTAYGVLWDFTLSSAIPFGIALRPTFNDGLTTLFGSAGNLPAQFQLMLLLQSLVNLILIFLIGLALRNFFRYK